MSSTNTTSKKALSYFVCSPWVSSLLQCALSSFKSWVRLQNWLHNFNHRRQNLSCVLNTLCRYTIYGKECSYTSDKEKNKNVSNNNKIHSRLVNQTLNWPTPESSAYSLKQIIHRVPALKMPHSNKLIKESHSSAQTEKPIRVRSQIGSLQVVCVPC